MDYSMLHTPEGVRDIYNEEIETRDVIIGRLKGLVKSYGYDNIKTPTFEFLSVYYKDITLKRPKDLYKFFDNGGNTLVLRPDFTPSIARAASKYFTTERTVRLFYEGNVFANNKRYRGRLTEMCQFGCELMGEKSIGADSEIIAIVINSLKACSIDDFVISIGHANIIKELIAIGEFNAEETDVITGYINNRNIFDLEKYLSDKGVSDELIKLFVLCNKMYKPGSDKWNELIGYASKYDAILEPLKYLDDLAKVLESYGVSDYISFEPGSVSEFDYYTGITFAGYASKIGEPIAKGGRYDNLLSNFGQDKPAIGFGIFVEEMQMALYKQGIELNAKVDKTVVIYSPDKLNEAIKKANEIRQDGKVCELIADNDAVSDIKALYDEDNVTVIELK